MAEPIIISTPITAFKVMKENEPVKEPEPLAEREEQLYGRTYKIKPANLNSAFYVTINNREGKPYEIFVNTKCPASLSWLMAYTRMFSALMRDGKDITFMIKEMLEVTDPTGGYYAKGVGFVPSIQAHLAMILAKHIVDTV